MPNDRFIILGNPDNRRVTLFQQALAGFGYQPARLLAYVDLLASRACLANAIEEQCHLAARHNSKVFFRIESPGEDFAVERGLLALGANKRVSDTATAISQHAAQRLRTNRGRIFYPSQWYAGYCELLNSIATTLVKFPEVRCLSSPSEIQQVFDKRLCHRLLTDAGVPTAPALDPVQSLDELYEAMERHQWKRVFVKLSCGSSASGVIAIFRDGKVERAVTTMEIVGNGSRLKIYNNLKLRVYTQRNQIRQAVEFLCREGMHVEKWLPKATLNGRQFDLRVVTIAGKATHVVVRTSNGPITNLHLGNRRGDLNALQSKTGTIQWMKMLGTAEQAAAVFSKSLCLGIDLLVSPHLRSTTVLEVNAFGDLLPGVLFNGQSTYEAQIAAIANCK